MPRLLVLSDIHANLEALEAVLADAPKHDAVLCLGDLVGYGPNPNECVARVRALPHLTVLIGNHDLAALGLTDLDEFNPVARAAAVWTGDALTTENRQYLGALQPTAVTGDYFLAHGSPRDPVWEYLETNSAARQSFKLFSEPVCFVGHTHVPRVLAEGDHGSGLVRPMLAGRHIDVLGRPRLIINPGGVGQPRDGDPRAAYGLWDTESARFTFCRVPYPLEETQRKIIAAGLPAQLAQRLSVGL